MHEHNREYPLLVNAEVDSMGGVVDCGVADTKASPLHTAIEKAQAELRQEYDVREVRRRELEFLENGGDPLDFKIGHAASISVQSTSLTDQLAEQYVISEAKGSFALAASPHGDSVESCGRLGGSLGREANIADNLLLFDGENSNIDGERNVNSTGKRGNAAQAEQFSLVDSNYNGKESEDSVIFRLGLKGQAYARRNRSRSSRDNVLASPTDLILGHSNKSSISPSPHPDSREEKGSLYGAQPEDHAISSISNSKPMSSKGNVVSKAFASDDQLDMELDAIQTQHTCSDMIKGGLTEGEVEPKVSENLRVSDHENQHSHIAPVDVTNGTASRSSDFIAKEETVSVGFLSAPIGSTENIRETLSAERVNGSNASINGATDLNDDLRRKKYALDTVTEILSMKNTRPNPYHVSTSTSIDVGGNVDQSSMLRRVDVSSDRDSKDHSAFTGTPIIPNNNVLKEKSQLIAVDAHIVTNDEPISVNPNPSNSSIQIKDEVELCEPVTDMEDETRPLNGLDSVKLNSEVISKLERIQNSSFGDSSHSIDKAEIITSTLVQPSCEPANAMLSKRVAATTSELQNGATNHLKLAKKSHEDAILNEARIIEANLRRAGQLPMCTMSSEKRKKCHWDFVLEEMAWMANDFMQERIWKTTVAAQVCHWIASSGQTKFKQENISRRHKSIARTLAKAIMHFWHSVEIFRSSGKALNDTLGSDLFKSWKVNEVDAEKNKVSNNVEAENTVPILQPAIQGYAVRFLDYNSSMSMHPILAEAPATPDRINDAGILEMSGEDQLSEESLFYMVPPGAMQAYRESVESQWGHSKKTSNILHEEECEASMCDSVADGSRENAYEEDEGETGTYLFPGSFEGGLSSKFAHRKKKDLQQKSYARRLYEVGSDLSYEHCMEVKSGNQPFMFTGKRPSSTLNVGSAPIKRARRAARHRVVSPFSAGVTGSLQVTSKTDVSSDDTNSFQDDQSSLHGGSHSRRNLEVEYTADFERQMPFDGCEISSKSKKKKKPKHLGYKNSLNLNNSGVLLIPGKGSLFEQRLQVDSMVKNEQRDYMKKRSESQHFESNGNCVGHYRQHAVKKPKLLKQLPETSPEAINPFTGSMPSPVASQMSNMSSPHKLIKTITNRDRGRKSKAMKMAAGQSGSGIPWSNFEEQALVVLVHDMGTNWELISDAINSTLQFKRVFRRPSECKEHHKFLMDSSGDGADSAEDSGSSQPYETTLRGIPKGSARQLFQRLRAPVEEDTLKAHFEKIILIGQKLHACRSQNVSQELKQPTPAHSSHAVALSQVCPNNLTGGVLTPLDLCEASSLDVLPLGYQGSHSNGLPIPTHQGSGASVLPTSSANPMLQGSPSMVLGNSLPSPSASHNGSTRDAQRYGMPRPVSLPADDQQRMPQYNHMISGRNIPQSSMSVPGALSVGVDRSVRMLPGGTGMGMMCGINRGMPMPRPGYQGISPPGMLNMVSTGSMLSGSGVGMPMPVNIHPSSVSVPGNSMMRPRDALQILRPGQNTEDHRQMMMQELQLQVSQGNGQSVSPFNGMSASFSSATVPPPVQTFPGQQHQQSHQMPQQPHMLGSPHHPHMQATNHSSPQQQAYAIRFAKDRQLQQRVMPQPQHPFTGSNTISPIQNSPQVQQQGQSSSPSNPIASSQSQHKHQQIPRNPQSGNGIPNPMMKPRQRQQVQHQQPRSQQQQRQPSQQQGKVAKGLGRGAILMHQNLSVDSSHASGLSTVPKNQVSEKHIMQQGQGFFPGNSVLNQTLSQPSNQPKMYPRPLPQTSKQMSQIASHSDNPNQGSVQVPPSHTLLASQQPPVPPSLPLVTQQQQQQQQTNQSQQSMQRMSLQQNRQINSDGRIQSSTDQVQVNQMISATSIQQCSDSSAPVVSSGIQWKPEPSYETSTPTSSAHLASSPQENLAGTESLMPPSSQGLVQRQVSGSLSMPKHGIGGQWQQQQQPQQQQQQPQLQHRQAAPQGNLYARPSSSGPG